MTTAATSPFSAYLQKVKSRLALGETLRWQPQLNLALFGRHRGQSRVVGLGLDTPALAMAYRLLNDRLIEGVSATARGATRSTELAHYVRNPLTAIQGASQALCRNVQEMVAATRPVTADDKEYADTLCRIVTDQIGELDKVIEAFLICAAENPAELAKLSAEAYARFCTTTPSAVAVTTADEPLRIDL